MGRASASLDTVLRNVPASAHQRYRDLLPLLWQVAEFNGVDPVVMAAQFAKETGWGHYRGQVTPEHRNPCGLKCRGCTGDAPEDHQTFTSWHEGFTAQAQHLGGYAARDWIPPGPVVDPRWYVVQPGAARNGVAPTVRGLNGNWAGPTYGDELEAGVRQLRR